MAYVADRTRVLIAWSRYGWRVVIESQATIESDAENSHRLCHRQVDIRDGYWLQRWHRSQLCGCAHEERFGLVWIQLESILHIPLGQHRSSETTLKRNCSKRRKKALHYSFTFLLVSKIQQTCTTQFCHLSNYTTHRKTRKHTAINKKDKKDVTKSPLYNSHYIPKYMGCSDVSEFEHIYGHIFTTPSCVNTMHCLHEQEWSMLMRWLCERRW